MPSENQQIKLLRQQLSQAQTRAREFEIRAGELKVRADESEARAGELEVRADESEARANESEARANESEARASEQEARASESEARANEMQAQADKVQRELDQLRAHRILETEVGIQTLAALAVFAEYLSEHPDAIPQADLVRLFAAEIERKNTLKMSESFTAFARYLMSKGSEKTKQTLDKTLLKVNAAKKDIARIERVSKSIQESEKRHASILTTAKEGVLAALKQCSSGDNPVLSAGAALVSHAQPEEMDKEPIQLLGRRTYKGKETDPVITPDSKLFVCPECGSKEYDVRDNFISTVRHLQGSIEELVASVSASPEIRVCSHCNFTHLNYPTQLPVPVTPRSTVGQDLIIEIGALQASGLPIHRIEALLKCDKFQLGSSTVSDNVLKWITTAGGQGLVDAIVNSVQDRPAIVVDETPFAINQQAGKSKKTIESDSKLAYLLAISNVPGQDQPFVVYDRMQSRSGENLIKSLEKFKPKGLITDAYAGYAKVCQHFGIAPNWRQSCCIHFRRTLLEALNIKALEEVVLTKNGAEIAKTEILKNNPAYTLCLVIHGMRTLYSYEAQLQRKDHETRQEQLIRIGVSRRDHALVLLDNIDTIMQDLATGLTRQERGKYVAANNSAFCKPVVYYMNNREGLRAFATNSELSADSNSVERAIRPIACYKNMANFKQSQEHTDAYCAWLTLIKTAEVNKIASPVTWLKEFGRAYFQHCTDISLTEKVRDGSKGLAISNYSQTATSSFDFSPWLPWNYVQD